MLCRLGSWLCCCRDIDMLMAAKVPLPVGHPSIEKYVCVSAFEKMKICSTHPAIHANLLEANVAGYTYPIAHRSLDAWVSAIPGYPGDHDSVDSELRVMGQYDADHPNMDSYVTRRLPTEACFDFSGVTFPGAGVCPSRVPAWHPGIDASIDNFLKAFPSTHPRTNALFTSWMPSSHRLCLVVLVCLSLLRPGLICVAGT